MCWFENDIGISVIMCELNKMQEQKVSLCSLFIWLFGISFGAPPNWMSHTSRNGAEAKFVHIYCDTWQLAYTFLPSFRTYLRFVSFFRSRLSCSIGLAHGLATRNFLFFFLSKLCMALLLRCAAPFMCHHFVCSNLATVAPCEYIRVKIVTRYPTDRQSDGNGGWWLDGASCASDSDKQMLVRVCLAGARVRRGINIFTCFYTLHHFEIPKLRGLWVMTL